MSVVIKLVGKPPFDHLNVALESSQIVPLPPTWVETTPKRSHQIKIMPFIQTGLPHNESGSQKLRSGMCTTCCSFWLPAC
jgi:hypothetical protein